jgi:hypothetical protein
VQNHIYPDYDFSLLRAHHFRKEEGPAKAEETIDSHLLEVSKVHTVLQGGLQQQQNDLRPGSMQETGQTKACQHSQAASNLVNACSR